MSQTRSAREDTMKLLFTLLSVAVLAGCAYAPPAPSNYATRYAPPPADPSQWHVVSVTPVPPGTGARTAASSGTGSSVEYSSEPVASNNTVYVPQPVYVPYAVAPTYYAPAPYYYPPVSIGLDFMFGRSWGHHGRNFGGVGIGSRWGR
jgi:hypothetical protein